MTEYSLKNVFRIPRVQSLHPNECFVPGYIEVMELVFLVGLNVRCPPNFLMVRLIYGNPFLEKTNLLTSLVSNNPQFQRRSEES